MAISNRKRIFPPRSLGKFLGMSLILFLVPLFLISACSPQRRDYLGRDQGIIDGSRDETIDMEEIARLEAEIDSPHRRG